MVLDGGDPRSIFSSKLGQADDVAIPLWPDLLTSL
jgi:hypothetical protein